MAKNVIFGCTFKAANWASADALPLTTRRGRAERHRRERGSHTLSVDRVTRTKTRTQKPPETSEMPQSGHSPWVYTCDSDGAAAHGAGTPAAPCPVSAGIFTSQPHVSSDPHGLSLLRYPALKTKCFASCSRAISTQGIIISNSNYVLGETQTQTSPKSPLKGRLLSTAGCGLRHLATVPMSGGVLPLVEGGGG